MNSQKNVLQVLTCGGFTGPATVGGVADIDALPIGEMAFFAKTNAIATSGWGRFVLRVSATEIIQSNFITFAGWSIVSYVAPVLHTENVTVTGPTTGGYYQLQVIMDIKGMTGKYIKHGVYVAKTGDTATDVAAALVSSLNASLTREGNTALTVTSSLGVITVAGVLQTYISGKKSGNQVPFSTSLKSPEEDVLGSLSLVAATGTVTIAGGSGSIDSITVNSIEVMSGAENFDTDLPTTATAIAANITANTSVPNYSAVAVGAIITITADDAGPDVNGFVVVGTGTTMTTTDVNMSGGSILAGTNGKGTGNYVHEKEYFAWGNQDSFRYNSWRNNFDPSVRADASLTYDTQAVTEDTYEKNAHANIRVSKQILLAFNVAGSAPTTS